MRGLLTFAVPVAVLVGCAPLSKLATPPASVQAGSWDCAPTGTSSRRHRQVSISPNPNVRGLDLKLDSGQQFSLSPLAGGTDHLFSGPLYAWRAGGDTSVLTDIQNIQLYNCRQVGYGQVAALPASGRTLP